MLIPSLDDKAAWVTLLRDDPWGFVDKVLTSVPQGDRLDLRGVDLRGANLTQISRLALI